METIELIKLFSNLNKSIAKIVTKYDEWKFIALINKNYIIKTKLTLNNDANAQLLIIEL